MLEHLLIKVVVALLATWRLTSLLVDEDGPFDVFSKLRTWAGMSSKLLGGVLSCFWCASMWVAFGVALITLTEYWLVLLPFALSAGAIIVGERIDG